ncbi:MAG: hypothetical protein FWD68_01160 [Alphaproteobacteria bacterium]|nr:hypothetical protein [Alphaproteobacteria bacterium]
MSLFADIKEMIRRQRLARKLTDSDLITEAQAIGIARQYVDAHDWIFCEPVIIGKVQPVFGGTPLLFTLRGGGHNRGGQKIRMVIDRVEGKVLEARCVSVPY